MKNNSPFVVAILCALMSTAVATSWHESASANLSHNSTDAEGVTEESKEPTIMPESLRAYATAGNGCSQCGSMPGTENTVLQIPSREGSGVEGDASKGLGVEGEVRSQSEYPDEVESLPKRSEALENQTIICYNCTIIVQCDCDGS